MTFIYKYVKERQLEINQECQLTANKGEHVENLEA